MLSPRSFILCVVMGLTLTVVQGFGILPNGRTLIVSSRARLSTGLLPASSTGRTHLRRTRPMTMQSESKEAEDDFELTVDWDEELRKLNAGELHVKPRYFREKQKRKEEAAMGDWVKSNTRKAKAAAQQTTFQVRGAVRKSNPAWQRLSRDWRFWAGVLAAVSLIASFVNASSRSSDLVVLNDVDGEFAGCTIDSYAYAAFLTHAAAQATGETASQLLSGGAATMFS